MHGVGKSLGSQLMAEIGDISHLHTRENLTAFARQIFFYPEYAKTCLLRTQITFILAHPNIERRELISHSLAICTFALFAWFLYFLIK